MGPFKCRRMTWAHSSAERLRGVDQSASRHELRVLRCPVVDPGKGVSSQ